MHGTPHAGCRRVVRLTFTLPDGAGTVVDTRRVLPSGLGGKALHFFVDLVVDAIPDATDSLPKSKTRLRLQRSSTLYVFRVVNEADSL